MMINASAKKEKMTKIEVEYEEFLNVVQVKLLRPGVKSQPIMIVDNAIYQDPIARGDLEELIDNFLKRSEVELAEN